MVPASLLAISEIVMLQRAAQKETDRRWTEEWNVEFMRLRVLREAGLVNWEKRGLWVHYALNPAALRQVSDYLGHLLLAPDLAGLGSA